MRLIKAKPRGYHPGPRDYLLPPRNPTSLQVVMAAIKRRIADGPIGRIIRMAVERNYYVVGWHGPDCQFDATAVMANATINATCGVVHVGPHVVLGHNVMLITGTHDMSQPGRKRRTAIPEDGRDITIEDGAFIGTGAIILGPCRIGKEAVVAAGAVVTKDVPPRTIVAGIPAVAVSAIEVQED